MIESSDPNVMNMPNDMNATDDSNRLPAAHPQQPSETVSILSPLYPLSVYFLPPFFSITLLSLTYIPAGLVLNIVLSPHLVEVSINYTHLT